MPLARALEKAYQAGKDVLHNGLVASYIPELAKSDPNRLGVWVITDTGAELSLGDVEEPFTLQSVAKVITLTVALSVCGADEVFARVGMEPTGDPFNSLLKLETAKEAKPLNPMINAGAIAVCSLLAEKMGAAAAELSCLELARRFCSPEPVHVNERVYESERCTGHRNRAVAHLLKELGVIRDSPEEALDLYLRLCSLEVTCSGLARMAIFYAHPHATDQLMGIPTWAIRVVNTFLVTCGMYDASGEFAIKAGISAKSGVSGAIMALAPERMGIGVIGPALDSHGNSIGGVRLLTVLSNALSLSMF